MRAVVVAFSAYIGTGTIAATSNRNHIALICISSDAVAKPLASPTAQSRGDFDSCTDHGADVLSAESVKFSDRLQADGAGTP